MASVPTVKVVHADGYMVINASRFDAATHTLYVEPVADAVEIPAAESLDEAAEIVEPFEAAKVDVDAKPKRKRGK